MQRTDRTRRTAGSARRPGRSRRALRRRLWALCTAIVIAFCALTARLFVWPADGMPSRVDAIVMLAGPGPRLDEAVRLAREHLADVLVVSRGNQGYGGPCPKPVPGVRLICFEPDPASTRGEAEFIGRLARVLGWRTLLLVTATPQDSRARVRVERCFSGKVFVVTVGLPLSSWPGELAYEWGALIKSLVWQRSC